MPSILHLQGIIFICLYSFFSTFLPSDVWNCHYLSTFCSCINHAWLRSWVGCSSSSLSSRKARAGSRKLWFGWVCSVLTCASLGVCVLGGAGRSRGRSMETGECSPAGAGKSVSFGGTSSLTGQFGFHFTHCGEHVPVSAHILHPLCQCPNSLMAHGKSKK